MAASVHLGLLQTRALCRSGTHGEGKPHPKAGPNTHQQCMTGCRSPFWGGVLDRVTVDEGRSGTSKAAAFIGPCRALADPDSLQLAVTGASALAPLAFIDAPSMARGVVAVGVGTWYFTAAKPGALQGLIDVVAAPAPDTLFQAFDASEVRVGKQLGEGSFGIVYKGAVKDPASPPSSPPVYVPVVLKRVKAKVAGAEEMRTSELYFNQRLQRTAPGSCAEFLGTVVVGKGTNSKKRLSPKLTEGLWLVWRYQGDSSLDSFLRRREPLPLLAAALLGREGVLGRASAEDVLQRNCAVVQAVMRHLLTSLVTIHATGVVHRDVKPLNLVLDEEERAFKLIDLGACVDLRTGYNYVPDETIMDPVFCAPEQYVMPISMPAAPPSPLMALLAPLLFMAHTPDKFDCFSAGLVLMQLAVPHMRADKNLAVFNEQLLNVESDLDQWRASICTLTNTEFEILDANGGVGWDLARRLLQPRVGMRCRRPTAAEALGHRFMTQTLTWQQAEAGRGSGKGNKNNRANAPDLRDRIAAEAPPASATSFRFPLRSAGQQRSEPEAGPPPAESSSSGRGRKASPLSLWKRVRGEEDEGSEEEESFDRKVKLKAATEGATSAVAWSALLPIGRRGTPPADAPQVPPVADPAAERYSGLRRLLGMDGPAPVEAPAPVPASPPERVEAEEFPYVAALAAWLGQTAQAMPEEREELVERGKASAQKIADNGGALAAAGAVLLGCGCLGVQFVGSDSDATEWGAAVGLLGMLGVVYLYVIKPGLSPTAVVSPRPRTPSPPLPLYQRVQRKAGSIMARAGLSRAGSMTLSYTNWLVKEAKLGKQQTKDDSDAQGLLQSLQEMEQQLAALEAAAREGRQFDRRQKQLLSKVQALLQETSAQSKTSRH